MGTPYDAPQTRDLKPLGAAQFPVHADLIMRTVVSLVTALLASVPATAQACSVALALTVDVSGSISPTEYELQMSGMADAMEDPTISEALVANNVAITVVQWSGAGRHEVSVPWFLINDHDDLSVLTDAIRQTPRAWRHFSTAIGDALDFTAAQFANAPPCSRHVIDVSGDGFSNEGGSVSDARARTLQQGIVINGLAIENNVEGLSVYYGKDVTGGPGSFVLTASSYRDYPRAIRRKLLNEVVKPAS